MSAVIVNICVDPRLNHEAIRTQVGTRLERMGRQADRIFITNDIGGNVGSALRNTIELLVSQREAIVLAAVLYHDDCVAERAGMRRPLTTSAEQLAALLTDRSLNAALLTGSILTETSQILWSDEPLRNFEVFNFRMPRVFG